MAVELLRAADHRVMPWKNGGGVTTEIAVSPAGAGLDDFGWRLSMARVETDGPFSAFPGVDRTLAVLDGAGIILSVQGRIPIGLLPTSDPLPFPADVATTASLFDGPITDLNVMTRRGRYHSKVERLPAGRPIDVAISGDEAFVLCLRGRTTATIDEIDFRLAPLDCLRISGEPTSARIASPRSAQLMLVQFFPSA